MSMVRRLRKYRILNCLLVSLFIGFYVSNTLFVHTHYYQGYSITHSANDLRVISAFNASVFFAAETVTVDDVCRIPVAVYSESGRGEAVAGVPLLHGLRAPPVRSV